MITVKLFKSGQNQAIRIPKDFEFKGVNNQKHFSKVSNLQLNNWVNPTN